ncbi:MAG: ATP-binding protein [Candidatus Methanomethylicia archaeon]
MTINKEDPNKAKVNKARIGELKALNEYCSRFRTISFHIYGPERCGKTRLLREFVRRFNDFFMDGVVVYIDALEDKDVRKSLTSSMLIDISKIGLEASWISSSKILCLVMHY